MRDQFVRTLSEIAREDRNTVLVTGDLGFGVLTNFAREFPCQYLNAGVAEQNMTALAVGMALEGKTVYTYSIANFPTLRCLEQIRNDACYHQVSVKIVAVGGGFAYGPLGISHHATEDLAIMRALPNMTVLSPGDPREVDGATRAIHRTPGTCYLRLGRGGEPAVHEGPVKFEIGKALPLLTGGDVAVVATGSILREALDACQSARAKGRLVALYSMPTVQPLDRELVESLSRSVRRIITVEEHSIVGGLGSAVAEVCAEVGGRAVLRRVGLREGFSSVVGDQAYLRKVYGMSREAILEAIAS